MKLKRYARIWSSVPDEKDGFFVEIIEQLSAKNTSEFQVEAEWFPTLLQCESFAKNQEAERVEYL